MNKNIWLIMAAVGGVLVGGALVGGCGQNTGWILKPVPLNEALTETVVSGNRGWLVSNKIAIIDVSGVLMNARSKGLFSSNENPVSLFVEKLDKAQADPHVKAVILRIDSPGGAVTASDIMYHRLLRFRKAKKVPVIAEIEDVGASGAYYLACGSDDIMAHPTSITGSIGVIMETVSLAGTMKMIGVTTKAVTSGPYKDMASPFKPLDDKDLALIKVMVDSMYQRFLHVVATGRPKLTLAKIKSLADGRVYTAQQALANGLIDQIGYMSDAIQLAKTRAGISKAKVVMYSRPTGYRSNVYSATPVGSAGQTQINLLNLSCPDLLDWTRPRLMYLWTGGR